MELDRGASASSASPLYPAPLVSCSHLLFIFSPLLHSFLPHLSVLRSYKCRSLFLSSTSVAFYKHKVYRHLLQLARHIISEVRGCCTKINSLHPSFTSPLFLCDLLSFAFLFLSFLKWWLCDTPLSAPGNAKIRFHLSSLHTLHL